MSGRQGLYAQEAWVLLQCPDKNRDRRGVSQPGPPYSPRSARIPLPGPCFTPPFLGAMKGPKGQGVSGPVTLKALGMAFWVNVASCDEGTRGGRGAPLPADHQPRPLLRSTPPSAAPGGFSPAPKAPQAPGSDPTAVASCLLTCPSMGAHLGPQWLVPAPPPASSASSTGLKPLLSRLNWSRSSWRVPVLSPALPATT